MRWQQRFSDGAAVNIDVEMASLLTLQNAYGANARVMATVERNVRTADADLRFEMAVGNVGARSLLLTKSLVVMRSQLGDLQRQLATGKRAETYAGIGLDRGLTVGLRSHLAAMKSYGDTITNVDVRLELSQSVLSRIAELGHEVKAASAPVNNAGPAIMQQLAEASLGEILGLLNTQSGDRYLFSGLAADTPSVETLDHILNGDGARAGLKQIVSERTAGRSRRQRPWPRGRVQADAHVGAGCGGSSGNGVRLQARRHHHLADRRDASRPPAGVPPQTMSVDLGATNPNAGENVKFTFALPDGTTETITLTATASTTPAAGEFTIGASSDITATNLQNALTASLTALADTRLAAASALAASDDFFNIDAANPPQRVAGPPFNTATALVNGTAADTVTWYTGEAGATAARSTATAKVDQDIGVSYGLRANEEGIRWQLQQIAALAAIALPDADPDTTARMRRAQRSHPAQPRRAGRHAVDRGDPGGACRRADHAAGRQGAPSADQCNAQRPPESVEGVSNEEIAAKILAMQTTLQASLQTTAILYQTNILKYL